ncbi:MAG: glycine cleavage system protein GcvH [Clostridia bacterium]|nr:glycine cleavage system protein GcvH [Clostridia bacterium]MBQ3091347.1 glycine cleavage system protein GcvH [Clostridia bacterium]
MNTPANLKYSKSHEWVKMTGENTAEIGLTDFAQDSMGDIVFVELPEVGDAVTAGESFGNLESVKAVSDVFSPVTGVVTEINEELLDNPALINESCYDAWMIRVGEITETENLLTGDEYDASCQEEA